ncbi:MAG: hypothetical protein ACXWLH_05505 [Candidatus Saccharimonadales bacterium]
MTDKSINQDHLVYDLSHIERHLPLLDCLTAAQREWPDCPDLARRQAQVSWAIEDALAELNREHQDVQTKLRWSQVAAHAIQGASPHFLNQYGACRPMPAQAYFKGFDLLATPEKNHRLYIRSVSGIQVFWSLPKYIADSQKQP